MQALHKEYPAQTWENNNESKFFEDKLEHFLHKLVKVWFVGIFVIGIPYFLYVSLQFFHRF
jgi:hypothetical protein